MALDMTFVNNLAKDLAPQIEDAVKPYLQSEQDDLKSYATLVARNMARAIGGKGSVDEVKAQVRLLGEITRIRAQEAEWAAAERVLTIIFQAAATGAMHAVGI